MYEDIQRFMKRISKQKCTIVLPCNCMLPKHLHNNYMQYITHTSSLPFNESGLALLKALHFKPQLTFVCRVVDISRVVLATFPRVKVSVLNYCQRVSSYPQRREGMSQQHMRPLPLLPTVTDPPQVITGKVVLKLEM